MTLINGMVGEVGYWVKFGGGIWISSKKDRGVGTLRVYVLWMDWIIDSKQQSRNKAFDRVTRLLLGVYFVRICKIKCSGSRIKEKAGGGGRVWLTVRSREGMGPAVFGEG